MKTMKDYHDLCLKCDVLLLVDVFEEFRNNSLKNYGLSLSHYLLNVTKVELNLFQILTYTYSLEKVREVEFLIFLIDRVKPKISI